MTQVVKYTTTDDLREVLSMIKNLNRQIEVCMKTIQIVDASLQAQINLICGKTVAAAKTKNEVPQKQEGLKVLHKQAEVPEKDNWEA